jgi:hypothetical protein
VPLPVVMMLVPGGRPGADCLVPRFAERLAAGFAEDFVISAFFASGLLDVFFVDDFAAGLDEAGFVEADLVDLLAAFAAGFLFFLAMTMNSGNEGESCGFV